MLGFRRLTRRGPLAAALVLAALIAAVLIADRDGDGGQDVDRGTNYPKAPADAEVARVERVVDGDTIRLAGVGPVRLIGVDTPEAYGDRVECFGPEATRYVERLLPPGARVRYTVGEEPHDRYDRLLVYLVLPDGRSLNRLLLASGHATVLTIAPNDRLAPEFAAAERAARRAKAGIWSRPGCAG